MKKKNDIINNLTMNTGVWIFLAIIAICITAYYIIPEFKIIINNYIEGGGFGSGSNPDNPDYTPEPATTCASLNLATEFSNWMGASNLAAFGNSCTSGGGIWKADADEVGCSVPPAYTITCGTMFLNQLENYCVNTLKADWVCSNTAHYVGCLCDKNPPEAQDDNQDQYTCAWHSIVLSQTGQCDGTFPQGTTCQQTGAEACECKPPIEQEIHSVGTIFVSATKWNGAFGGLTGGDEKCQVASQYSTLGLTGTWKILASDATINAKDRITDTTYRTINGDLIANSKADLFDGTLSHAVDRDENNLLTGGVDVWTGTNVGGNSYNGGDLGTNCHNWGWVTAGYFGIVGNSGSNAVPWIENTITKECKDAQHIYCVRVA